MREGFCSSARLMLGGGGQSEFAKRKTAFLKKVEPIVDKVGRREERGKGLEEEWWSRESGERRAERSELMDERRPLCGAHHGRQVYAESGGSREGRRGEDEEEATSDFHSQAAHDDL